jgi:hypothetical protein
LAAQQAPPYSSERTGSKVMAPLAVPRAAVATTSKGAVLRWAVMTPVCGAPCVKAMA